jgi:hypothetical protein
MDLLRGYGSSSEEAAPQDAPQAAPAVGVAGMMRLPDAAQLFADAAPIPRLAATGCAPDVRDTTHAAPGRTLVGRSLKCHPVAPRAGGGGAGLAGQERGVKRSAVAPVLRPEQPKGGPRTAAAPVAHHAHAHAHTHAYAARLSRAPFACVPAQRAAQPAAAWLSGVLRTCCYRRSCVDGARWCLICNAGVGQLRCSVRVRRSNQPTVDLEGMGLTRRPPAHASAAPIAGTPT